MTRRATDPTKRCTWRKPSRTVVLCHTAGTAWWWDSWGSLVVRCPDHYSALAADNARALGWTVEEAHGTAPA